MILNTQILGNKTKPTQLARPCVQKMPANKGRKRTMVMCLAMIAISANLAACGQKGPLYLPAPASTPSTDTPSK